MQLDRAATGSISAIRLDSTELDDPAKASPAKSEAEFLTDAAPTRADVEAVFS